MRRKADRFVIGSEDNVVRVDFSRDPDPPAPRFPGASGLREIGDEISSATDNISVGALRAPLSHFLVQGPGSCPGIFIGVAGAVNVPPDG
jgi:hypothetical protein